ncbi:MAG: ATP-binding protein [Hyphomonadaceae bacterium]|nr:ATP-binding protein [Hyphomonadaceae bacterium]
MSEPSAPPMPKRGWPIAAHLAALVAMALAAAYIVNIAAVVMLPPRPSDVMRGDKVLDAFVEAYAVAKAGRTPRSEGARWSIADQRPRTDRMPRPGKLLTRDLARRLDLDPGRVVVAFDPTPSDVVVFRVRREEMRVAREAERNAEDARRSAERPRGEDRRVEEIVIEDRRRDRADAPPRPPEPPEPPLFAPPPPGVVLMSGFLVAAELPDGRWLTMRQQSTAETIDWIARAALGIGATLAILLLLALLFARRLAAPIQRFADSARRVGVDPGEAPVREEGPRELRTAARAVNAMQARLRALVAERTEMLAAVAHDLRTPLMRMRLVAENADPALRDKLVKEAAEIDALVSSFIAFARDDPTREARVRLDLAALVQSLVDDRAEAAQPVTYEGPDRLVITGQALGLKRLVDNLVDNALKYGAVARVRVRQDGEYAVIEVADEGPGVPPAEREKVFRPFVRGETAGAQAAGAGLGLSAAREIARAHGGDVEIGDAQPRGALITVRLPV